MRGRSCGGRLHVYLSPSGGFTGGGSGVPGILTDGRAAPPVDPFRDISAVGSRGAPSGSGIPEAEAIHGCECFGGSWNLHAQLDERPLFLAAQSPFASCGPSLRPVFSHGGAAVRSDADLGVENRMD